MRGIKRAERQREVLRFPSGWLASGVGIGLLPKAPGTWASAATLPFGWLLHQYGGPYAVLIAAWVVFFVGVYAADRVVKRIEADDPSVVVIDEIAGQLLVLVVTPLTLPAYLAAFVAFRFFDLLKFWPASYLDREVGGGFGAMADDMVAGLYGLIAIYLVTQAGWL